MNDGGLPRTILHADLQITFCGAVDAELVLAGIEAHRGADGAGELKNSPSARVTVHPELPPGLCVKSYSAPRACAAPMDALGLTRARRAWRGLLRLREVGVPAAEPLALATPTSGRGPSWLLTRLIPGAEELYPCYCRLAAAARDPARGREARRERRVLLERTASLVAGLHAAGCYHPDLSPQNVVVERAAGGSIGAVRLVDLDSWPPAVWPFGGLLTRRRRHKNLAQLGDIEPDVRARDKRRFAILYQRASASPLGNVDWPRVVRMIERRKRR